MKKILLSIILLLVALPVSAAQQTILGGAGVLWGDEKVKINSNFSELYGKLAQALLTTSSPTFVDLTLTSDLNVKDWIYFTSDDNTHYVAVAAGNNTANYVIRWPEALGSGGLLTVSSEGQSSFTAASSFQAADAQLDTWATVTPSAFGQSLVSAANYAAMRTLLDVEPGVDYDAATPSTLNLTTDTSITEAQLLANKFISNQGASGEVDITLPAVSYSITRTVLITETQIAEINPPSGEAIDLSGTMLDANDCVDSSAIVGSKAVVTRMQDAAGTWVWSIDVVRGTWEDTGASD